MATETDPLLSSKLFAVNVEKLSSLMTSGLIKFHDWWHFRVDADLRQSHFEGWGHLQLKGFWVCCGLVCIILGSGQLRSHRWTGLMMSGLGSPLVFSLPSLLPPLHLIQPSAAHSLASSVSSLSASWHHQISCFRRAFPVNVAYFRSRISCQWFNKGIFLCG